MSVTLASLKADTLRGYRQRQMVTGTVGSFTTTMIQDATNRFEPDGEWDRVDAFVKFTSGAPLGVERQITGWSTNSTLAFSAVPSNAVGVAYQLTKTFRDADVSLAVNEALRDSFPQRVIEGFATGAEIDQSYRLIVPSAALGPQAELVRVERSVGTTNSAYDYEVLDEGIDYVIERDGSSGTLILANTGASGVVNRFHFRRPAAEMAADTDTTDEPSHVIILGARKFLAMAEGDTGAVERWGREESNAKHAWLKNRQPRAVRYPFIVSGGG